MTKCLKCDNVAIVNDLCLPCDFKKRGIKCVKCGAVDVYMFSYLKEPLCKPCVYKYKI